MNRQRTSWFQGWKITLRCTEFNRQDGSRRFASTAILQHAPMQSDPTSLHWPDKLKGSRVHTEDAFCTCEEADTDAFERAKREISELDMARVFNGRKMNERSPCTETSSESDESLAARFEISFDGKRYTFRQYRYDRFQDALRYAIAERMKVGFLNDEAFRPSWMAAYQPTVEDESVMRLHGITYLDGRFLYGGYCYSRLCDAVTFAEGHPNL